MQKIDKERDVYILKLKAKERLKKSKKHLCISYFRI